MNKKNKEFIHLQLFSISATCTLSPTQPSQQRMTGKPFSFSHCDLMPCGQFTLPILPAEQWSNEHCYQVYFTGQCFDHISPLLNHQCASVCIQPSLEVDWHWCGLALIVDWCRLIDVDWCANNLHLHLVNTFTACIDVHYFASIERPGSTHHHNLHFRLGS